MENTTRDFWKMIMDYKVSAIVMLCGLEENGMVSLLCFINFLLLLIRKHVISIGQQQIVHMVNTV